MLEQPKDCIGYCTALHIRLQFHTWHHIACPVHAVLEESVFVTLITFVLPYDIPKGK